MSNKYLIEARHIKFKSLQRFSCFGASAEEWRKAFVKCFPKFEFLSIKSIG